MSILKKPYEISVWQDIWQGDKFCEQRLGIIGTNEMLYQGRAIEPNLIRNANGTKKFSFKMYKHFIDTATGEKVENPFIDWLISERKVKLKYEKDENGNDIWYDFIIKDVVENSSNYLYTYQLEDVLVQELSKNGFGVTLDEQLRNNMGNVERLAIETLKETDWIVESEVFVERVDEALVYVQLPESLSNGSKVYKLLDDEDDFLENGLKPEEDDSVLGKVVLAFYSSCRNKPHRFQFIYLPNYDKVNVSIDKNRQILNKNCQYYIEFEPNEYTITNANYGFILPEGFGVVSKTYIDGSDIVNASDSTISTWYRGGRYGFAQKAEYIPLLDRYCQVYSGPAYPDSTSETGNSNTYYGYADNKYEDLIFSTNLVENTEFSNTSGWTSTYKSGGTGADKAVIENVYGKFDKDNKFVSITDVLAGTVAIDQTFEEFLNDSENKCVPYLKVELKSGNSLVINSGPYHNRTIIGDMPVGSKWAFRAECYSNNGSNASLTFDIDEYIYNTTYGHYSAPEEEYKKIKFVTTNQDDYTIYTVETNNFEDKEDFTKNCKLKIAISGNEGTYYIKNLEFFRARFDKDNKVIPLESQGTDIENLITTQYRYFKPSELDTATEAKNIHYDYETDTLSYETYKPVYNTNGEKIRAVSAKESNYFNILQSIAETFECWLDLQIIRDDPTRPGAITQKIAKFKNYAGRDNYACFRYGVNLKDIQRTYSSKNIVTKLMVKQNSNEHGENGMCTIARAGANPTGDTSIYDFSYFQNMGLMNAHDYIDTMYKIDGAEGPDIYACLYSSSETKPELPSSYTEDDTWHIKKRATDKYVCFWKRGTNDPVSYECISTEACNIKNEYNIQGYFPRIRAINDQLLGKIDEEIVLKQRLLKLNSDLEVQKAKQSAAASGMEEASESYFQVTGVYPTELVNGKVPIASITLDTENKYGDSNEEKRGHLSYYDGDSNPDYTLVFENIDNKITIIANPSDGVFQKTKTLSITAYPILTTPSKSEFVQTLYFTIEIKKDETSATSQEQTPTINTESSQVKKYFNEYATYTTQKHEADIKVPELESSITALQDAYNDLTDTIQTLKDRKIALNNLFFTRYSRFIQEGSWIDEKYYDDEKYYSDALSVMYNSCYPQVAYTINTFEVSQLPGYEMFNFNVGEKTWAEDGEFFGFNADGSPKKEEVIITEKSENLDDPSKNTNKVQNFKNQFQDLFQRIVATVQQAQYSTGAYEKGVAEANAIAEDSVGFLRETMSAMTVNLDNPQVMSESTDKSSQLRIVDGKVLIGKRDQNTEEISWTTGLSSDGIAADLINTGRLNTSEIQIYSGDNPTFRWDAKGISAYDYTNFNNVISGVNTNKFVRFDKNGLYGINGLADPDSWAPESPTEALEKATFGLTWEGLKVTGANNVTALIGKKDNNIIKIVKKNNEQTTEDIFTINTNGDLQIGGNVQLGGSIQVGGNITWGTSSSPTQVLYNASGAVQKPSGLYKDFVDGTGGWYKTVGDRKYASYTYDGGNTWGEVIQIVGAQGPQGPKGDRGDAGTGVSVKENESMCVAIGDGYIDADGNLMILTSLDPREFTNGGQIKGPKGDTTYFHTAYANSADGEIDFSVSDYANKEFIGHYTDTVEADSTNPSDYKWSKMKGDKGEDGSGIKKIDTYVRDFPYYSESSYSWTGIKAGGETAFVDPGHSETWTADNSYDNSHIRVGDTAYLVGTVSDQFSADGVKQSITLYGNVTAVTSSGVTMTTTNVVWGGTQGDTGPQGPQGDNGENAKDFNVSASSYMLSADSAGNIKTGSKVILTAHAMNLDSSKIQWSTDNSTWKNTGSSTYEVTATGTYYARVKDTSFKDSVTIGKTIDGTDGQDGVDAISINLTNPTMTFNNSTSGESEICRVVAYEGATKLSSGSGNSQFSVAKSSSQAAVGGVSISGDTITVSDQTSDGSYTITVTVKNKKGIQSTQDFTIYWTAVTSPYSMDLTNDSAVIVTDKDGNNGGYGDNAKTTATVYHGSAEDSGWTYTVSPASNSSLTYTLSNSNRTIAVTNMTTDSGQLTISAAKTGYPTQTKVFKISKLKQGDDGTPGANGTSATSYWLVSSLNTIAMNQNGGYKDTTLTFTAKKQTGVDTPATYATKLVAYKDDSSTELSTTKNGTLSITLSSTAPTKNIRCVMYYGASGTSILDEEKVLVVKDGEDGNDGVRGTGTLPITTLPTAYTTTVNGITSAYRITLSTVKSESKATEVLVGDILESSYYHYPVIYVSSDYVYCGARRSIQGEQGEPGLVAKSVFNERYETNSIGSVETTIFNRTPKVGEIFTNLCANTYYTTFEVTAVNEDTVSIKSTNEISYTTRNGIVDALNELKSVDGDGIYKTDSGKIGINASAIKTGCITFGDNSDWYIDPFNAIGEGKYLNLPGLDITDTAATFNGTVYAKAGEIGGLKIGEIASTSSVNQAKNEAISSAATDAQQRADAAQGAAETTAKGYADAAQTAAEGYAEGQADAARAAAEATAKGYTDSSLKYYTPLVSDEENFSWELSPNKGFYMYNGKVENKEEVFKIYKPTNKENYEAWLKGHVEAESGDIGGISISENGLNIDNHFIVSSATTTKESDNLFPSLYGNNQWPIRLGAGTETMYGTFCANAYADNKELCFNIDKRMLGTFYASGKVTAVTTYRASQGVTNLQFWRDRTDAEFKEAGGCYYECTLYLSSSSDHNPVVSTKTTASTKYSLKTASGKIIFINYKKPEEFNDQGLTELKLAFASSENLGPSTYCNITGTITNLNTNLDFYMMPINPQIEYESVYKIEPLYQNSLLLEFQSITEGEIEFAGRYYINSSDLNARAIKILEDGSLFSSRQQVSDSLYFRPIDAISDNVWKMGPHITSQKIQGTGTYYTLQGLLKGTWKADSAITTGSSRNVKYAIEDLPDKYSTLFDNLKPVRYKYRDGESKRYHTGFILDELKTAMDAADVSTEEFAAYCIDDEKTLNGGIRYEEIIALLTNEVQQLKKQVSLLEEKLNNQ